MKKKIDNWIKENEEDYCDYCIYIDDCPKGMVCYGGVPIEPYCVGHENPKEYLDTDAILDDIENKS